MTISVRAVRRLSALGWLAAALLGAGLLLVALGVLPGPDAEATLGRIAPILVFLAAVVVLAELAARAEVFDVVAARVAIAARGHRAFLFVLLVAFATATTVILNLDTTAVLLTPVMLALADRIDVAPLPVAMTTVWLPTPRACCCRCPT
jgi:arsenical pump membrane protein